MKKDGVDFVRVPISISMDYENTFDRISVENYYIWNLKTGQKIIGKLDTSYVPNLIAPGTYKLRLRNNSSYSTKTNSQGLTILGEENGPIESNEFTIS